eukprot:206494_1
MKWRPTIDLKRSTFRSDIRQFRRNIIKKTSNIIKKDLKNGTIIENTRMIGKLNASIKGFNADIKAYTQEQCLKKNYPQNITRNRMAKAKNWKATHNDLICLVADKTRGNVIGYKADWNAQNMVYLESGNYMRVPTESGTIIAIAKQEMLNIVYKFKDVLSNASRIIKWIHAGRYDKIGTWRSMPKVYKVKKALRPIIDLKNTIISVSSAIVKEITRKLMIGIKMVYRVDYDCESVFDIIEVINQFNESDTALLEWNQQLVVCDIASMYDNISPSDLERMFDVALRMVSDDYLTPREVELWYTATNYLFKYMCFAHNGSNVFSISNSMVQGTISGGDCSTFVCLMNEILRATILRDYTKLFFRYKDDIFLMPQSTRNDMEIDQLLQAIYCNANFTFKIEIKTEKCQICDIYISIQNGKLHTASANDSKIRSYCMKTSDIVQNISGIFKTLQQRYIILSSAKSDYLVCKKSICQNLMKSGWTQHDIRNAHHLKYESRNNLLDKFIENRTIKRMNYFHTKMVQITVKNWFKIQNYKSKRYKKNDDIPIKREITDVIKYNKNYINAHQIKQIVNRNFDDFDIKYNIYFKYNKKFGSYL